MTTEHFYLLNGIFLGVSGKDKIAISRKNYNQLLVDFLVFPPSPKEPKRLLTIAFPAVRIMLFTTVLFTTFSRVLSSGFAILVAGAGELVAAVCNFAFNIS